MTKQLLTEEGIIKLIKENRFTYEHQPDRIIADYRGECAFTKDYNGRQILELLQNADDAGSKEVLIELNTKTKELIVSDNGLHPFDIDGIKSLMLANLSSKNKKEFIGNKGLGFRSILNWASSITIITNGMELTFSPDIAKGEFNEIVKDEEIKQKMLKEKDLPANTVPFPILAIPDNPKTNHSVHGWTTIIKIRYKTGIEHDTIEQDIKDQLVKNENKKEITGLRPEILLFLNSINKLDIIIDGDRNALEATIKKDDFTKIGDKEWHILDACNKTIENGDKHYRIKIAWKKDLSDTFNKLFTYFPTQVYINLPCLIHATFDLDVARNYLNKTDANKFILHELVEMLKQLALKISKEGLSWLPYKLLTPIVRDSNEMLVKFYDELDEIKRTIPVYPCVDGNYRTLDEVKFYNNEFSDWVHKNELGSYFPDLLQSIPDSLKIDFNSFNFKKYTSKQIEVYFQDLTENEELSLNERVQIIKVFTSPEFLEFRNSEFYLPLLLNRAGESIKSSVQAFTSIKEIKNFKIPSFAPIDFLSSEMYSKLLEVFEQKLKETEYSRSENEHVSRPLKRIVDKVVNIGSNDVTDVINNIISSAYSEYVKVERIDVILEMVQSLYWIYADNPEGKTSIVLNVPLLNKNEQVLNANKLFLNASFPSGELTEDLYEGILTSNNFLIDLSFFKLEIDDENLVEKFFIWMGVNKYAKYDTKFELRIERREENNYLNFVFPNKENRPQLITNYIYKGTKIDDFDNTVAKLSPERILLLVLKDEKIRQKLEDSHEDQFDYVYNRVHHSINSNSYVSFQLSNLGYFDDFLVDNHNIPFINRFEIDLKNGLFEKYKIDESTLKYFLSKLGAKQSFNDIEPKRIYELLNNYHFLDPEGKTTQKFYTLALNALEKHSKDYGYKPLPEDIEGLTVFAKCNGVKKWLPSEEVKYSNNTVMPGTYLKDKYILNVPKRFGESKVKLYLNVTLFNELILDFLESTQKKHQESDQLIAELQELHKYILGFRIKGYPNMDEKTKKSSASLLKNYNITLVERGKYTVGNEPEQSLRYNEFINEKDEYYLCAKPGCSLQTLKKDSDFCDAISEIFCIVLKVWEQRDIFRAAFITGEKDLAHQFRKAGEEDVLKDAQVLLGLSKEESNFWKAVFKFKGFTFSDDVDTKKLKTLVGKELGIPMPATYSRVNFDLFNNDSSYEFLRELCNRLNITLSDIEKEYADFPALRNWHLVQIKNKSEEVESNFVRALWKSLISKDESEQQKYISTQNKFHNSFDKLNLKKLGKLGYEFEVDYLAFIVEKVKKGFGISIDLELIVTPENLYKDLLDDNKIDKDQLTDDEKSLLYFDGNEERLKEIFNQHNKEENKKDDTDESKEKYQGNKLVFTSIEDIAPLNRKSNDSVKGSGVHNPTTDKNKKRSGKNAERLAYYQLVNDFGKDNVQWVSGFTEQKDIIPDDTLGYDFRYRTSPEESYSYLEVKSITSNSFIISYNEVSVGLENREKYHLGLVKDGVLNIITDFFTNKNRQEIFGQLQINNSIRPRDYDVYFKLPERNNNEVEANSDKE